MAGVKGRSGRKKQPTAVLKLHGTYREDRHGDRKYEPRPQGSPKQQGLSKDARLHWDVVVPRLVRLGIATENDGEALRLMCLAWAELRKLERMRKRPKNWMYLFATANKIWIDYASRFGMTPTDRTKVKAEVETQESAMEEFIG